MAKGFKNSVKNSFKRMNLISILIASITILLGIILLCLPEKSNKAIGVLVGIVIFITGLNALYKYFKRNGAKIYSLNLLFGVVFTIIGILLLIYPYTVMQFVTICFGIAVIVNGATKINNAIWLKRGGENSWSNTLASGILLLIIGLLIVFNPFANLTLTKLSGAFLLLVGILDLVDAIAFSIRSEEIISIFW